MAKDKRCTFCGKSADGPWLLLNRFGIGFGQGDGHLSEAVDEGEYLWGESPEGSFDDPHTTGVLLCWPSCSSAYLELEVLDALVKEKLHG